jgi:glycosyltransferase involved in cell wall biosynthesis
MTDNQSILLTIAIPSYNRSGALIHTLEALASQLGPIGPDLVEVIVSDNYSSDGTQECVRAWIGEHPTVPIRYFRNETNIGFDANCDSSVRRARGRFVWLMADDDFLESGAIARVHSLLEENKDIVFAYVNYSICGKNWVQDSPCLVTSIARGSGGDLIARTRFAFSFVSSCVFKKDLWLSENASRYFGTGWIHLFMARDILLRGESLLIGERLLRMNAMDLVETRKEKKTEPGAIEFYMSQHLKFVDFALSLKDAGYSVDVVRQAINVSWANNLRQIVFYKITADQYAFEEIVLVLKRMARYFGGRWAFWAIHVPVLFLPNVLVSGLYRSLKPLYAKLKQLNVAHIGAG